jgi:hypothetical protein
MQSQQALFMLPQYGGFSELSSAEMIKMLKFILHRLQGSIPTDALSMAQSEINLCMPDSVASTNYVIGSMISHNF